ncbi:MAG: response regulator [Endomicrobiales bacterium]|nr:response regulator [Endomicrobiales bacterium]
MTQRTKVLIIDADEHFVNVVTDTVKDLPPISEVHSTIDMDKAKNLLKNDEYCAILADIGLISPDGMTGIDFVKDIVNSYGETYFKRIIVTSHDIDRIVEALRCGAYMSIIKPFEKGELKHKLNLILNHITSE